MNNMKTNNKITIIIAIISLIIGIYFCIKADTFSLLFFIMSGILFSRIIKI
jgi:hypothetical protein